VGYDHDEGVALVDGDGGADEGVEVVDSGVGSEVCVEDVVVGDDDVTVAADELSVT
jgi:hypothetical protein